ncbi:MAG: ATP-dependent Clp protease ATP-binding subunit ClpC, partial [Selenomonadaceae bacterium]|nr:ATP-dependent Clp protease ATP-binding subunit ClpC [Selenomonadaceae bacterium]
MSTRNRFTNRAIKAIEFAQYQAQEMEQDYIGTDHLLLGLLHERGGVAARALATKGLDFATVLHQVEGSGVNDVAYPVDNPYYTPIAKHVMEMTVSEAHALGHNYIGTEHSLLSILKESECAAVKVLTALGMNLEEIRNEVIALLGGKAQGGNSSGTQAGKAAGSKATPLLNKFGRNLNDLARQDKMDPVIGRQGEIQRVIQILSRRT